MSIIYTSAPTKGEHFNRDPLRVRKLLLHKKRDHKVIGAYRAKGYTLIPLRMYLKRGKVKIEIASAAGKHLYDKRQDLKEKAIKRDMEKILRKTIKNFIWGCTGFDGGICKGNKQAAVEYSALKRFT